MVNKLEMSNPKNSLINCISTTPIYPVKNTLEIVDSGMNKHLSNQATKTKAPVIISNEMKEILTDGITMESSHIAKLHITGPSKQSRHIQTVPKTKTSPLISLGVLCDDGWTITLDKQDMSVQKNGK